jgi:hypothetical protein
VIADTTRETLTPARATLGAIVDEVSITRHAERLLQQLERVEEINHKLTDTRLYNQRTVSRL